MLNKTSDYDRETQKAFLPEGKVAKSPLITLEIDRIALDRAGIDQKDIERIYSSLYANSSGFYDMLRSVLSNVSRSVKYQIMGRIWRAYQMLLENCCPTDFQSIEQKLKEDAVVEINKVREEFASYRAEIEGNSKKLEAELQSIQGIYTEVLEEKDIAVRKRQEAERKLFAVQTNYEDEVRLRLDFEIKINKLHNLTMALKNREKTLDAKIEELERDLKESKDSCRSQAEEIVQLRSWKIKQEMDKQLDEVKLESSQKNELETKERLIVVTQTMQQKDSDLASKTSLNLALQNVVDQRNSRIRALQDAIDANKDKQAEIDAQYQHYHKQLAL